MQKEKAVSGILVVLVAIVAIVAAFASIVTFTDWVEFGGPPEAVTQTSETEEEDTPCFGIITVTTQEELNAAVKRAFEGPPPCD